MDKKIEVGILGATGTVGQRFVQLLENHPWFELNWLGASDRSAGKSYREATSWQLEGQPPADVAERVVEECVPGRGPRLVFSSMSGSLAGEIERDFAAAGHIVVSNSSHYRMAPDVPLLVPEINPGHLSLLAVQRRERGWEGAIVTNPNCAAVVLVIPLAALRSFGIRKVAVTTFQAVSGAGYPGVPSLDILGNVIPYIGGDEEKKVESEPQKILGELDGRPHPAAPVHGERELQPGAVDRRPPDLGERRVRAPAGARGDPGGPGGLLAACPRSAASPRRRSGRSTSWRRRTARSRARTPGWSAAWPPPSGGCGSATSSTGSSPRSRTTSCAAPPAPPCSTPR